MQALVSKAFAQNDAISNGLAPERNAGVFTGNSNKVMDLGANACAGVGICTTAMAAGAAAGAPGAAHVGGNK
jgi:hypothetical protein